MFFFIITETNVCSGDSGGSLVFNQNDQWFVGGIISLGARTFGSDHCDYTQYALFTDVTKFTDWIENKMST